MSADTRLKLGIALLILGLGHAGRYVVHRRNRLELFSIGRRTHSTGFCVPWPVSDFKFLSICHNVVWEWSPTQDAVLPLRVKSSIARS